MKHVSSYSVEVCEKLGAIHSNVALISSKQQIIAGWIYVHARETLGVCQICLRVIVRISGVFNSFFSGSE